MRAATGYRDHVDGDLRVIDRPAELAYRLYVGEREAGELRYARQGDRLVLVHTEVDRSLGRQGLAGAAIALGLTEPLDGDGLIGRQGLGSELVRAALDDIRTRGLEIVPRCPFVRRYLERHPEYADLVADPES